MGLDIAFYNPDSGKHVIDEYTGRKRFEYAEKAYLAPRHGNLRVIDWLPYASSYSEHVKPLYPNIRSTHGNTFKEFKAWCFGLHKWIIKNHDKYAYLTYPRYSWQNKYFGDGGKKIMFCDVDSIHSHDEPTHTTAYVTTHSIYWTETRTPDELNMLSDAIVVLTFINELVTMNIPDNWIVETNT